MPYYKPFGKPQNFDQLLSDMTQSEQGLDFSGDEGMTLNLQDPTRKAAQRAMMRAKLLRMLQELKDTDLGL